MLTRRSFLGFLGGLPVLGGLVSASAPGMERLDEAYAPDIQLTDAELRRCASGVCFECGKEYDGFLNFYKGKKLVLCHYCWNCDIFWYFRDGKRIEVIRGDKSHRRAQRARDRRLKCHLPRHVALDKVYDGPVAG